MSKDPKYRVALIGGGRAGPSRARAFDAHPLCAVVAVADTDPENLELTSRRFGAAAYATWDEMFAREQLDIVLPILPVRPNADAVVAAAEAGVKAIFCEKPLTASLADADRMVDACARRGIPLGAGVMVSSHPDYRRAYGLASGGTIGRVHRINLYGSNNQGGCHGVNLTRKFAAKAAVEEVIGRVSEDPHSDHEHPYDDAPTGFGNVGGWVRFDNGVEAFLGVLDPISSGIEVIGSRGMVLNRNNTGLGLQLRLAPKAWRGWASPTWSRWRPDSGRTSPSPSAATTRRAGRILGPSCALSSTTSCGSWRRAGSWRSPRGTTCATPSRSASPCASRTAAARCPSACPWRTAR